MLMCMASKVQHWSAHPISHCRYQQSLGLVRPALRPAASKPARLVVHSEGGNGTQTANKAYSHLENITCDLSAFPQCELFRVEALLRPWRLDPVVSELAKQGIVALTATNVKGAGAQGGTKERYSGRAHDTSDLIEKAKLDIVVFRDQVDVVVRIIAVNSYTGEIGDGKIFVHPVADVIRVRTGQTGREAQIMAGGMAEQRKGGRIPESDQNS